jgi:23S rRNA pseudouridine1911/1915/1917 synthase
MPPSRKLSLKIPPLPQPVRLDLFLAREYPDISRALFQKWIRQGMALVNGARAKSSLILKGGEAVWVEIPPPEDSNLKPEPIPLEIIWEDESLLALNKPPGLVVHPAPGHATGTLVHALLYHLKNLSAIGGTYRPGIVHRLDKDTSGVLLVAKTDQAHQALSRQFKSGTMAKHYLALALGCPSREEGIIEAPIGRHPVQRKKMAIRPEGRPAVTAWQRLFCYQGRLCLLFLSPKTGRTHQIRVHLKSLGHPVWGDPLYDGKKRLADFPSPPRTMLHALSISFRHPREDKVLSLTAPFPPDFLEVTKKLDLSSSDLKNLLTSENK